jgi:hypothetical protein
MKAAALEKKKAEIGVSAFKEGEAGLTIFRSLLRSGEEAVTALSRPLSVPLAGVGYIRHE